MKHLLILISILLLSSPVIGNNHKGETLYLWETSSGLVWKSVGSEKLQPKYEGQVENGIPNGQGTITYPDGRKYVGEYKNGKIWNGQGTKTWTNGDMYEGEFKDGLQNGQGTYTWSDGRKYVGEWKDGETKRSWYCHFTLWEVCGGMEGE